MITLLIAFVSENALDKRSIVIGMGEIALDALYDSLKILGVAFVVYFLLSFFEGKVAELLEKKRKFAPLIGSLTGSIPQCGISVVASDLFTKGHLTPGTLLAIYLATSDEAMPILFGDFGGKWYMGFALLGVKMVGAAFFGTLFDLIYKKGTIEVDEHLRECQGEETLHYGCCGHEVEGEKESPWHEHLLHPLFHSFKIFVYAFIINFLFSWLVSAIGGETALASFLSSNLYLSPLYAIAIGLIPNCASSVVLSEVYILGGIPFGALVSGLAVNAGLGPLYLFKNKKTIKHGLIIMGVTIICALIMGYSFIWVTI
jgi:hypothetical protein